MATRPDAPKIRPDHLDRLALIYVRQSTPMQVRENTASTARQYDLAGRARDLGWPAERVQVIDQDQGRSGASTARPRRLPAPHRPGRTGPGRGRPQPGGLAAGSVLQRLVSPHRDLCPDRHTGHRRGRGL